MKRVAVLVLLGLSAVPACAPFTYRPPSVSTMTQPVVVAASFDRTWDAAISWFVERNIPIQTIDKSSGVFVADAKGGFLPNRTPVLGKNGKVQPRKQSGPVYADCGQRGSLGLDPTSTVFNIRVQGDAEKSTAYLNVRYTESGDFLGGRPYVCNSTGKWESEIETYIRQRAESGR